MASQPTIPKSLQPQRQPTSQKPPTVAEQKLIKKYGSLERAQQVQTSQRLENVNKELTGFSEKVSYENYEQLYNKLSPEAKARVAKPEELKKSKAYKTYQTQKRQTDIYNEAMNLIQRKISGKRINLFGASSEAQKIYKDFTSSREGQRALTRASELKSQSRALGFGENIQEFIQAQKIIQPKIQAPVGGQVQIDTSTVIDKPIGSAVGGGVIRQTPFGDTYVDITTTPSQAMKTYVQEVPQISKNYQQTSITPKISSDVIQIETAPTSQYISQSLQQQSRIDQFGVPVTQKTTTFTPTISEETKRYENLGYTKSQSRKLAKESLSVGGMTFTPETSEKIIKGETIQELQKLQREYKDEQKGKVSTLDIGTSFGLVSGSTRSIGSSSWMDRSSQLRDNSGRIFGRVFNRFQENRQEVKESYSPSLGMFVSASPTGEQGTAYLRPPTPEEKEKIEEAQYKGDLYGKAIYGLPAQLGGGIFTYRLTPEESASISKLKGYFSPKKQFEIFKSQFDYKLALKEADKVYSKLENLDKQYESGKIDYNSYSAKYNYYSQDKNFRKVLAEQDRRGTLYKEISDSNLSRTGKIILTGIVASTDFLSYVNPVVRVARGTEAFVEGVEQKSPFQAGMGAFLVGSGLGGAGSLFGGIGTRGGKAISKFAEFESRIGITGGVGQRLVRFGGSRAGRITGKTVSNIPGVGFSGAYGYDVYRETGDVGMGIAAGIGGLAGIKIPEKIETFVKDKPLNIQEVKTLEKEIETLDKAEVLDASIIKKGEGKFKDSSKVEIRAVQETPNFVREIKLEGDLITNEKGTFLFPTGKGTVTTRGKFKFGKQREKRFVEVREFLTGAMGESINLGQIGNVMVGTSVGQSTYIPTRSVSQILKTPRNIFESVKESFRAKVKPKVMTEGGDVVVSLKTEKKPESLSLKKEIKVSDEGTILKRFGVSATEGRRGTFFEIEKPKTPKKVSMVGKITLEGVEPSKKPVVTDKTFENIRKEKTPFSKTFGVEESVSKPSDLISSGGKTISKMKEPSTISKQISKTDVFGVSKKTIIEGISKGTRTSLKEFTKTKPRFSNLVFVSPREQQKIKESVKQKEVVLQAPTILTRDIQLITPSEIQKQKTGEETLLKLEQQQIQKTTTPLPSFILPGEKLLVKKPQAPTPKLELIKSKLKATKEQPYYAEVLRDSTNPKKRRWENLNPDKPLTEESALSLGAREADESISAQFRITKAKPIIQKVKDGFGRVISQKKIKPVAHDTGDTYFKTNKNKFRNYQIKQGKKINIGNRFIEKSKFRIETGKREFNTLQSKRKESQVKGFFGMR